MIVDAESIVAAKFGIPADRYKTIGNRVSTILEGNSIRATPMLIAQEIRECDYTTIEAAALGFLIGVITGKSLYEK